MTALRAVQLPGLMSSKDALRPLTDACSLLLGMHPAVQLKLFEDDFTNDGSELRLYM